MKPLEFLMHGCMVFKQNLLIILKKDISALYALFLIIEILYTAWLSIILKNYSAFFDVLLISRNILMFLIFESVVYKDI